MKIFLIGMPGAGKTTIGEKLAKELSIRFIDLDSEIVEHAGISIAQIFQKHGENYFRQIESKVLTEQIAKHADFVMATGGGAPCFHDNIETMKSAGVTVFLDVPLEELTDRLAKETETRPLIKANDEDAVKNLYERRLPVYNKAHVIVDGHQLTEHTVRDALIKKGILT